MPARKLIAQRMVEIISVIAHPDRFRLIEELSTGEKDVNEITEILGLPQSTVSQHLAALRGQRLVRGRREGRHVHYSLTHPWMAGWMLQGLRLLEEDGASSAELLSAAKQARKLWKKNRSA